MRGYAIGNFSHSLDLLCRLSEWRDWLTGSLFIAVDALRLDLLRALSIICRWLFTHNRAAISGAQYLCPAASIVFSLSITPIGAIITRPGRSITAEGRESVQSANWPRWRVGRGRRLCVAPCENYCQQWTSVCDMIGRQLGSPFGAPLAELHVPTRATPLILISPTSLAILHYQCNEANRTRAPLWTRAFSWRAPLPVHCYHW